jgi:hypothetical protein
VAPAKQCNVPQPCSSYPFQLSKNASLTLSLLFSQSTFDFFPDNAPGMIFHSFLPDSTPPSSPPPNHPNQYNKPITTDSNKPILLFPPHHLFACLFAPYPAGLSLYMGNPFSFPVNLFQTLSSKRRCALSKLGTWAGRRKDISASWRVSFVFWTAAAVVETVFAAVVWRKWSADGGALRRLNGSREYITGPR